MVANQYLAPATDGTGAPKATTPTVTSSPNALLALDATGHIDLSVMPVGTAEPFDSLPQTGALAAGDIVNIYSNVGVTTVRKADASAGSGKIGRAFVQAATSAPGPALVYYIGDENTGVSGLTPGVEYFMDPATPGGITATQPTAAGSLVESVGIAISATKLAFQPAVRYVN